MERRVGQQGNGDARRSGAAFFVSMAQPKYVSRDEFVKQRATQADNTFQLRKQFVCEDITKVLSPTGDASRQRKFVISTGAVDRDNDTIAMSGWLLDNYKMNPVVLFAHDYSSLPIGKAVSIGVEEGKLVAIAEFAAHQMADTCLQLIDGGFLRATSVGFRPTKVAKADDRSDGYDFKEQELLEFSVVPVPANPEALIVAAAAGVDLSQIKDWALGVLKASRPAKSEQTPPPEGGQGMDVCPACGGDVVDGTCTDCGWHSPDGISDANALNPATLSATAAVEKVAKDLALAAAAAVAKSVKKQGPGAEAAELVTYQAIATMLDQVSSLLSAGRSLSASLISDEVETPTETPEGEAAEEAMEWARLESLNAFCSQMNGGLYGVQSMCWCLLRRFELAAELAAAQAVGNGQGIMISSASKRAKVAKRGRVLSSANETRIKSAKDHVTRGCEHLDAVLASLPSPDDGDDDTEEAAAAPAVVVAKDAVVVPDGLDFEIESETDLDFEIEQDEVTLAEVKDAMRGVIESAIGQLVRDESAATVRRLRGRVD